MNKDLMNNINEMRRDFAGQALEEGAVHEDPVKQFGIWFKEAVDANLLDPSAMSVTSVNASGQPSTRIVYMRDLTDECFVFYTNYNSTKGKDLTQNKQTALNFFWGELNRQVRIEGVAEKISTEASDDYFSKRPRESQIGAWASSQSELLSSRAALEEKVAFFTDKFKGITIPRPPHWGGYIVQPTQVEFWQGRPNRLHDRIVYSKLGKDWNQSRLSP